METVVAAARVNPLLQVAGVSKYFGGARALQDVSFSIDEGEVVALIGPNGAGKTTLFNIITGVLPPDAGKIIFRGQDITRRSLAQTARVGIVRVFQKPRVFVNLSVWENVLIGCEARRGTPPRDAADRAALLLEAAGLTDEKTLPAGSLTFAQKRFLELVRALGPRPRLLLLDEPAAGLSPKGQEDLVGFLRTALAMNNANVLFIEHCPAVISALATRYVILNNGVKVFEGSAGQEVTEQAIENLYVKGEHVSGD